MGFFSQFSRHFFSMAAWLYCAMTISSISFGTDHQCICLAGNGTSQWNKNAPGLYPFIETWGLIHTRYHSISWRPWAFTHSFPGNGRTGSAYPETKNPLQHATPRRVQNFTETASHHPAALWIPFRPYCSSSKFLNWNLMYHISVFLSSAGIHCPCLLLYGWLPALPISLYIEGGIQIW